MQELRYITYICGGSTILIWCKAVAEWLTNNWRPKVTTARQATGTLRVSYLDILYRKHDSKMVKAVQEEFNVTEFAWSDKPYFGQRLRIGKEVYAKLTEAEKEDIQQELKRVKEQGWDPENQKMYVPWLSRWRAAESRTVPRPILRNP